ncbi:DUF6624 domain-containing protein [Sphingomonas floccifaciens]|uniref:DUF6624 domain-containing protein n=1 Tax=Sphingomonas floccifaciens TaxID=1844115 RepID=A0ABW4NA80_9SPHN
MRFVLLMFSMSALVPAVASAQSGNNIDISLGKQIVIYTPTKRDGVTDAKFKAATAILAETRAATEGDASRLNAADYWNVASAFVMLNESDDMIGRVLTAGIQSDPRAICEYLGAMGPGAFERIVPAIVLPFQAGCESTTSARAAFDPAAYATKNRVSKELVIKIMEIGDRDQKYRAQPPVDWSKQAPLDHENQLAIQAIFRQHGRYVGRDLVGKRLETVMWSVVQHSDIAMMREYLPVIRQAVTAGQLELTPFKMLIDRVQTIDTGVQIFGSQVGVPLADDATRAAIKARYGVK